MTFLMYVDTQRQVTDDLERDFAWYWLIPPTRSALRGAPPRPRGRAVRLDDVIRWLRASGAHHLIPAARRMFRRFESVSR